MSMVCPKCHESFESSLQCPTCDVRLLFQDPVESRARHRRARRAKTLRLWHQTQVGRLMAGLIVGLGLSFGLLQLCSSSLELLSQKGSWTADDPVFSTILFYALQGLALLAAGAMAAIGRRQGVMVGALVGMVSGTMILAGVWSGKLDGMAQPFTGVLFTSRQNAEHLYYGVQVQLAALYLLPITHLCAGAIGGFVGSYLWKPPPDLVMPASTSAEPMPTIGLRTSQMFHMKMQNQAGARFSFKISWGRVLVGMGLAIGGAVWTRPIIDAISRLSEGALKVHTDSQEHLAIAVVFSLLIFLGGAIAGTNTCNGLIQGIFVGVGGGVGQVVLLSWSGQAAEFLNIVALGVLVVAPLGGWFGSSLLPPASGNNRPRNEW